MEYRKLISFGKSSFVISLPKAWVTQHNLKKGDLVYLEESGPQLVLGRKPEDENERKEVRMISVDNKSEYALGRETHSAYIRNYHDMVFQGKNLRNRIREIQQVTQSLIALEVMEQTSDTFVAKDFLDMDTVSIEELLRKMDIVTRTMMKEAALIFKNKEVYAGLKERDGDVNRLYFLLYRAVLYNLENPTKAMKNLKHSSVDVLRLFFFGFYTEAIADEARRTARYAADLDLPKELITLIETFLEEMYTYYSNSMKAAYACDIKKALELSDTRLEFDDKLEKIETFVNANPGLYKVVNRLQRMSSLIHNLGRVIYTLY